MVPAAALSMAVPAPLRFSLRTCSSNLKRKTSCHLFHIVASTVAMSDIGSFTVAPMLSC